MRTRTAWAEGPQIVAFTGGALSREAGFAPLADAVPAYVKRLITQAQATVISP